MALWALLFHNNAAAQMHIGYKHGTSFWLTKSGYGPRSISPSRAQSITYDKEIVLRTYFGRNITVEHGIQHYTLTGLNDGSARSQDKIWQVNTNVQLDVSSPLVGYLLPMFSKLKSFSGLSCSPRMHITDKSVYYTLMLGINYMHQFPITDKISLCSQFSYQMSVYDNKRVYVGETPYNNRRISWQTSVLYKIK